MDLSLALGRPIGGMSEREFWRWHLYAQRKGFPLRRLEWALAMVALKIVQCMGGDANAKLADFVFEPARDDEGRLVDPPEATADDAAREWLE
jgi:hypothetical protein